MKAIIKILAFFLFILATGCANNQDIIMVVSASNDGKYAIATSLDKKLLLWDLANNKVKLIDNDVNIYSAYFIKGSDNFIYQDNKTNEVRVENINGQMIEALNPGFPVYGNIITSDLKDYFAVDENDQLFLIKSGKEKQLTYYYCNQGDPQPPQNAVAICGGVQSDRKIANLFFTPKQKFLLVTLAAKVYVWNLLDNDKLVKIINYDAGADNFTMSPDGEYFIGSDINSNRGLICNNSFICKTIAYKWNKADPVFAGYFSYGNNFMGAGASSSVKFISKREFLNFIIGSPNSFNYAVLFSTNTPLVKANKDEWNTFNLNYLKSLSLNIGSYISSIADNSISGRNLSVDTVPQLNLLITGAEQGLIINVYHYDTTSNNWIDKKVIKYDPYIFN